MYLMMMMIITLGTWWKISNLEANMIQNVLKPID